MPDKARLNLVIFSSTDAWLAFVFNKLSIINNDMFNLSNSCSNSVSTFLVVSDLLILEFAFTFVVSVKS